MIIKPFIKRLYQHALIMYVTSAGSSFLGAKSIHSDILIYQCSAI
jgi:hypothetical protein